MKPEDSTLIQSSEASGFSSATVATPVLPFTDAFVDDIRSTAWAWDQAGLGIALITLVNVEGSSPRPVGSQMVVNERGEYAGLISSGCVESALVHEAVSLLRSEAPEQRLIRYGRDSDYFDIQLPCGSGIDVLILTRPESNWLTPLCSAYQKRLPVEWSWNLSEGRLNHIHQVPLDSANPGPGHSAPSSRQWSRLEVEQKLANFSKSYRPRQRVVVVGQGAIFDYFLNLARAFDWHLVAYSSQFTVPCENANCVFLPLNSPAQFVPDDLDPWTAVILLSHDHDWEVPILKQVLSRNVGLISALGSRKTHEVRRDLLRIEGISDTDIARINGPAGLNIGGQTPPEIALSIVAEVVSSANMRYYSGI
ncbi:MAG: XdhC family protein [Pseudomonadales bacterium]|nr:XdhC family protein [Pseudomonadales bacterium]